MKKKIISNTYLKDVLKYQLKLFYDEDDYYVSLKKIVHVKHKFFIKNDICIMDDGYYVLEIVPKRENYAMRLYLDREKKPLEYYFDITKNNGLYLDTCIPCYDDLYLDITYLDGDINILDEDELLEAYRSGDIDGDDLALVYRVRDELINGIKDWSLWILNIDYRKYLNNF